MASPNVFSGPDRQPSGSSREATLTLRSLRVVLLLALALLAMTAGLVRDAVAVPSFGLCLGNSNVSAVAESHGGGSGISVSQFATPPPGGCPNGQTSSYIIPPIGVTTGDHVEVFHNSLTGQTETAHMTGAASLDGVIALGTLRGGIVTSGIATLNGPVNGIAAEPAGSGSAHLQEFWIDRMKISSGVLPTGTPVELRFTTVLSGLLSPSLVGPGVNNFAVADAFFQAGASQLHATGVPGILTTTDTMVVHSSVGAALSLEAQLILTASATADVLRGIAAASETANYSNTSDFFIDVLTPGASYITDSGQTYFSPEPTPEPSTFLLLGSGFAAVAGGAWRSRRKKHQ